MKLIVTLFLILQSFLLSMAYSASPAEISERAMEGYRLFLRDSLPDDRSKGYALMLDAAWEGDAKAANNVGWILQYGLNGNIDLKAAFRWYERAADQGLPAAALNYVDLLMSHPAVCGDSLPDSHRLAEAAMLAGSALASGRGLPYDYRRGEVLILKAGLLGDETATLTIAQQLEMYPDSFSYLEIEDILHQCDSLLPAECRNLPPDMMPEEFVKLLLTPAFWYERIRDRKQ